MTEEQFDMLVEHLVTSSSNSFKLMKEFNIDISGYDFNYNEVIDILGEAYFKDLWFEILEALFTSDPQKTIEEIKSNLFNTK
jgi:hypothetical protein